MPKDITILFPLLSVGLLLIPPWATTVINVQILEIMVLIKLLCCLLLSSEFAN